MRIDSAGRLLIGTTAGAAGRIVHASNSGNNFLHTSTLQMAVVEQITGWHCHGYG